MLHAVNVSSRMSSVSAGLVPLFPPPPCLFGCVREISGDGNLTSRWTVITNATTSTCDRLLFPAPTNRRFRSPHPLALQAAAARPGVVRQSRALAVGQFRQPPSFSGGVCYWSGVAGDRQGREDTRVSRQLLGRSGENARCFCSPLIGNEAPAA